jgi:hypothetical protein
MIDTAQAAAGPAATQYVFNFADAFRLHRRLIGIGLLLVGLHLLAMVMKYQFGRDMVYGIVPLFDFYEERNIPTYFSSLNLLLTAGMLWMIARLEGRRAVRAARPWQVLAFGFLFMSMDEFADLRMVLSRLAKSVGTGGADMLPFLSVAWTVPIAIILVVLAIYFVPFLLRLERSYLVHFTLAGAAFVFAAMGMETFEGNHMLITGGQRDALFMGMVTFEETLEIFSILYFQRYLIKYARQHYPNTGLRISL